MTPVMRATNPTSRDTAAIGAAGESLITASVLPLIHGTSAKRGGTRTSSPGYLDLEPPPRPSGDFPSRGGHRTLSLGRQAGGHQTARQRPGAVSVELWGQP